MSFSADWLALRADADRLARNAGLAADLAAWAEGREDLRVLDLGSGTGANLAALASLLPAAQHWVLADSDADLLGQVTPPEGIDVEQRVTDLGSGLGTLFQPAPDLVTASAFFDLCGAGFVDDLVARTGRAGAAFHTVLSYDGREDWSPPHPLDEAVLAAFHADQARDKGLGPALGPKATDYLARAFEAAGYRVTTGASDWQLSAVQDAALIAALARGSADAVAPVLGTETAQAWHTARARAERIMIGHQDLLALPPD